MGTKYKECPSTMEPIYKINCISRNYKDVNGYNGRGNYNSAEFYKKLLSEFKNLVIEKFSGKSHNEQLIREVFEHIEINHLDSRSIKMRDFGNVNIWFTQLLRHRPNSVFSHENDIIFTRKLKDEIGKGDKVTNGLSFSIEHNIDFYPKYYGKLYPKNTLLKQALGVYLRPDVLPEQVKNLIDYITTHKLDTIYDIVVLGPKESLGGYRVLKNALFTTSEEVFIERTNFYLYTFASENDTINNTLYNCILNRKRIIYVEGNNTNRIDNVCRDLKVLFKNDNIYYTTQNSFNVDKLLAINSLMIIENSSIVIELIKISARYFIKDILRRLNTELFIFTEEQINMLTTDLEYVIWKEKFQYNEFYDNQHLNFMEYVRIKQNELRKLEK